jgi:hypothetical protein
VDPSGCRSGARVPSVAARDVQGASAGRSGEQVFVVCQPLGRQPTQRVDVTLGVLSVPPLTLTLALPSRAAGDLGGWGIELRRWAHSGLIETSICSDLMHASGCRRQPPGAFGRDGIERRHVRLDVEHRCPIEQIHPGDLEHAPGDPEQAQHGETERVWMPGRSCGEDPAYRVIQTRDDLEPAGSTSMEVGDQVQMREPVRRARRRPMTGSRPAARDVLEVGVGTARVSSLRCAYVGGSELKPRPIQARYAS